MASALHHGGAVLCLALGAGDLVYLNTSLAPALAESRRVSARTVTGAPPAKVADAPQPTAAAEVVERAPEVAAPTRPKAPTRWVVPYPFGRDTAAARAQAIEEVQRALARDVEALVFVAGPTDRAGAPAEQQARGLERARAMAILLEQSGVERRRIRVTSPGAAHPRDPSRTPSSEPPAAARKHRRVELELRRIGD